jgi:hypothetical protein
VQGQEDLELQFEDKGVCSVEFWKKRIPGRVNYQDKCPKLRGYLACGKNRKETRIASWRERDE